MFGNGRWTRARRILPCRTFSSLFDVWPVSAAVEVHQPNPFTMENIIVDRAQAQRVRMHKILWVMQGFLFLVFTTSGILKLVLPMAKLADLMTWPGLITGSFSEQLVRVNGAAELLGGLAMLLPGLTRRMTHLTSWAGYGLLVVMVMAAGFHLSHSGIAMLPANIVLGALAGYVGWGRGSQVPLEGR